MQQQSCDNSPQHLEFQGISASVLLLILMFVACISSPVAYPRTSFIYEDDLWMGRITKQMLQQTHCLIVISQTSLKNPGHVLNLSKQIEKYSTETKLMVVVTAPDFVVDDKQFLNISINTLIFQIKAGRSRSSVIK